MIVKVGQNIHSMNDSDIRDHNLNAERQSSSVEFHLVSCQ